MSQNFDGKWGFSTNGESYLGTYDTPEEAKAEAIREAIALELNTECEVSIGQYRKPTDPEVYIDADLILEHSACQDDYAGDWGDDWPNDTKGQREELTNAIQEVYAKWLDRYDLRPSWGLVQSDTIQKFRVGDLIVSAANSMSQKPSEENLSSTSQSSE